MIDGIFRTGIYGGTYAPPHNVHIAAAKAFIEQMKLDELLIIPAAIPPHKLISPADEPEHRLRMCELAFSGIGKIKVSDIEIRRGGKSYTVDTLRELTRPNRKLFLLCGTDMMLTFDTWREFETIFKLSCPVYIRRENDRDLDTKIIEKNNEYIAKYGVAFRKIIADPVVMSSTEIREKIKNRDGISDYVPPKVEEYIKENKLYV
jgi:nicotinate-nucleotide adenylyltransferase